MTRDWILALANDSAESVSEREQVLFVARVRYDENGRFVLAEDVHSQRWILVDQQTGRVEPLQDELTSLKKGSNVVARKCAGLQPFQVKNSGGAVAVDHTAKYQIALLWDKI